MATTSGRGTDEIRASIERNREDLGRAIEQLSGDIKQMTDWRGKLVAHQQQILVGAAIAGFVLGGGIAGIGGLFRRRR